MFIIAHLSNDGGNGNVIGSMRAQREHSGGHDGTEAALRVFEKKRLKEIVEGAVLAAVKRSKELSRCLS